jgi:hypothetical protein
MRYQPFKKYSISFLHDTWLYIYSIAYIYIMEMELDLANILYLISFLSPLYVTFFMLMTSMFNQDTKALVWLGGVALFTMVVLAMQVLFKSPVSRDANAVCGAFKLPGQIGRYNVPSVTSYFIAFTLSYLMLPMMANKSWNYFIIIGFATLFAIDATTKMRGKCTTSSGILFGGLLGYLFGLVWYTIISGAGGTKLLYFNTGGSNNVICSKPKSQTYKCSVYKNGELISTA